MASTTHPSSNSDPRSGRARPSQIKWVFPNSVDCTILGPHVVGRDARCDTPLLGKETSRKHAQFRVDGPILAVRDLGSRNGVFVNGQRVVDAPLQPGDVVRCGEWIGVVAQPAAVKLDFEEVAPGCWGSSVLASAIAPATRVGSELPVIVQGETGTGKEGLARAVHLWSGRRGPFVAVNCAALPEQLAEAELFGVRRGAFTGAHSSSPGLFRAAHGGSLFLDEVLELPSTLQAKLLRALQEGHVRPVGETQDVAIDVRIIAATQEPLPRAVEQHRFRADLHARLDGLTIALPALRQRREDIVPLFRTFARQQGVELPVLDGRFVEALCVYDWPLNVRELQLLTRRLLSVHGDEREFRRSHLPERMTSGDVATPLLESSDELDPAPVRAASRRGWKKTDDAAEFEALVAALRHCGGSVAKAAAAVGLSRNRAYRVLSAHPEFSLNDLRHS